MILIVYALVMFGGLFVVRVYYKEKGEPREGVFAYSNRLDQIKEDDRISEWVESTAHWLYRLDINGSKLWPMELNIPTYHIYDKYMATYKGVDLKQLVIENYKLLVLQELMDKK